MSEFKTSRRQILWGTALSAASLGLGFGLGAKLRTKALLAKDLQFSSASKTGLAYHTFLNSHSREGHSENPYRTDAGLRGIQSVQELDSELTLFQLERPLNLEVDPIRLLSVAHSQNYIESVKTSTSDAEFLTTSRWSPYGGEFAFSAAVLAAALTTELANRISSGDLKNGLALVRPPGHHAGSSFSGGYCLFNNVAVAAATIAKQSNSRVAIVDLDVHHGNGTQDIFYQDPNVLYVSVHQDDWPYTGEANKVGEGKGRGTNINIPMPLGAGDTEWIGAVDEVIFPVIERFAPKMIFLSMGFDTHWRDPQGSMNLSSLGQAKLIEKIQMLANRFCDGKLCVVLEGGYQADVLENGIANTIRVLSDRPHGYVDKFGPSSVKFEESKQAEKILKSVKALHGLSAGT